MTVIDPIRMLRPKRAITGYSAILLPFSESGAIDWAGFEAHLTRTAAAGLIPAVNMDTGYGNLLTASETLEVLARTRSILAGQPFAAGAFVVDTPGASLNRAAYSNQISMIAEHAGTPVVCQSFGLTSRPADELIAAYASIGQSFGPFIAFELGTMFAPFGAIYSLDTYRELIMIPECIGAKHSSLDRNLEWQRLALRDALRPDFKVFTGNDLAIDMVMYGSDYLLGLSCFAPDLFARRDAHWQSGDAAFYELNDALQYLGFFAFRTPVPAYKHTAAMFLKLRGWIGCDHTHPKSPTRPASDSEILLAMFSRLGI
jgi:dihydrodipicolinate synthase/N-acetylneuraminate lyase